MTNAYYWRLTLVFNKGDEIVSMNLPIYVSGWQANTRPYCPVFQTAQSELFTQSSEQRVVYTKRKTIGMIKMCSWTLTLKMSVNCITW